MVTGDHDHVRLKGKQLGDDGVHLLHPGHLALEVAVFPCGVRSLVVNEEEVELPPMLPQGCQRIAQGGARGQSRHPHQLGQPAVHGIEGDGRRPQPEHLREGRQVRRARESTQEHHVRRMMVAQPTARAGHEGAYQPGGGPGLGAEGRHLDGGHAHLLGVGLVQGVREAVASEHQEKAMLPHRLHEQLRARQLDGTQLGAEARAGIRVDAASAAVDNEAAVVHGAEVAASRHVLGLQVEVDAHRLQSTAADAIAQGVVAEESQVAGPAARDDSKAHVIDHAANALLGQAVQIGDAGCLHLRAAGPGIRQAAQAVHHQQDDLGLGRDYDFTNQVKIHGTTNYAASIFPQERRPILALRASIVDRNLKCVRSTLKHVVGIH